MKYLEPKVAMCAVDGSSDASEIFLKLQKAIIDQGWKHIGSHWSIEIKYPGDLLKDIQEQIKDFTDLDIKLSHIGRMMILFPLSASVIISDPYATDARDEIMDMLAAYYLNSTWPHHEDVIPFTLWLEAMQSAINYFNHYELA